MNPFSHTALVAVDDGQQDAQMKVMKWVQYWDPEQELSQYIDDISVNSTEYKRPPLGTALSVCSSMLWELVWV